AMDVADEISNRFKEELQKQFGFRQKLNSTLAREIQERVLGRSFDMVKEYEAYLQAGGESDAGCCRVCSIAAQIAAEKIMELKEAKS
ncbi:MAG: hypothetical protein J7L78_01120, partial [Dehalococcoidales bacterium]|nr:hypothetical protein [Dehalococcoidales bacterium]